MSFRGVERWRHATGLPTRCLPDGGSTLVGYFLTNRDDDFTLAYGGPVVEWIVRADRRIGFGVRALVGAGLAPLLDDALNGISGSVAFQLGAANNPDLAISNDIVS